MNPNQNLSLKLAVLIVTGSSLTFWTGCSSGAQKAAKLFETNAVITTHNFATTLALKGIGLTTSQSNQFKAIQIEEARQLAAGDSAGPVSAETIASYEKVHNVTNLKVKAILNEQQFAVWNDINETAKRRYMEMLKRAK